MFKRRPEANDASIPPRYYSSLDFEALWSEYPTAPDYFSGVYRLGVDDIGRLQNERFLAQMKRGWHVPFYQRHWKAAGLEPGDIRSLDDLAKNSTLLGL